VAASTMLGANFEIIAASWKAYPSKDLLARMAADELPRNDVLELAKRVQIPGYEQTRELFQGAINKGAVAPLIRPGYYLQFEIQALLRWADRESNRAKIDPLDG